MTNTWKYMQHPFDGFNQNTVYTTKKWWFQEISTYIRNRRQNGLGCLETGHRICWETSNSIADRISKTGTWCTQNAGNQRLDGIIAAYNQFMVFLAWCQNDIVRSVLEILKLKKILIIVCKMCMYRLVFEFWNLKKFSESVCKIKCACVYKCRLVLRDKKFFDVNIILFSRQTTND